MSATDRPPAPSHTGGLRNGQFLAIVSLFWLYVTLSNVLYAYSMRIGIARITVADVPLFAAWQDRVMQHLLLLPVVSVSFWASLRVQWTPWLVAVPLQIILAGVFAAAAYPAMLLAQLVLGGGEWHLHGLQHGAGASFVDPAFLSLWVASFVSFLPSYGFGLALITGLELYTRFQRSELRVTTLEREWSTARLAALRMQLSPHTLFNLLHTIRGYIEWDPKGAQSMVVQLADLLRRLLSAGERDLTRLADELQFVGLYLELQQRRFPDRLAVRLPETREPAAVWVPSLILQPLVENAVIHGLAGHQGPVEVRVTAHRADGLVTLAVINTIAPNKAAGEEGIGIRNVRERLAVQFEGRAAFSFGAHGAEWRAEITMPEILESTERRPLRRGAPLVPA